MFNHMFKTVAILLLCIFSSSAFAGERVDQLAALAAQGDGAARVELAQDYLSQGGRDNERKASKLLRAVIIDEQEEYVMAAGLLLAQMKKDIRQRYPKITDAEYKDAKGSAGYALMGGMGVRGVIDLLVEEALCLSSQAQIMLAVLYEYKNDDWPTYDPRILKYFEETAKEGLPRSLFFLGHIYLNGWGVKMDEAKGNKYLEASHWQERGFELPKKEMRPVRTSRTALA